jgi:hypothetical protein
MGGKYAQADVVGRENNHQRKFSVQPTLLKPKGVHGEQRKAEADKIAAQLKGEGAEVEIK